MHTPPKKLNNFHAAYSNLTYTTQIILTYQDLTHLKPTQQNYTQLNSYKPYLTKLI